MKDNITIIKDQMKLIRKKLSKSDKDEIAETLQIHRITLDRYLAGKIGKESQALEVLIEGKKKISEREIKAFS